MSFFHSLEIQRDDLKSQGPSTTDVTRYPSSGINILIIGAGPAGLFAALECWRKGHAVRIIERNPGPSAGGDYFTIAPQIIEHMERVWPDLAEENERLAEDPWISYHKVTGAIITGPDPVIMPGKFTELRDDGEQPPTRIYRHNRPKFMQMLVSKLMSIGVNISYGHRVVDYYEDLERQTAGVVLDDGDKFEADIVIAADGLGTKSHKLVNGHEIRAISTGYSMYRTAFRAELLAADPVVDKRFQILENGHPLVEMWAGPDMSVSLSRFKDIMTWTMTHKDDESSIESWGAGVDVEKVLKFTSTLPGWPEYMDRLIRRTPKDGIVDWKLMLRDPQTVFTSPLGRVVQIGDSAHSFLPFSGNGANQAMEDGISFASCLHIGGKSNIHWAAKVHNKLRFERIACCQLVGFVNFRHLHNTDWAAAEHDTQGIKSEIGRWTWAHSPERYAYDNYGKVLNHLQVGTTFRNTNTPPGYIYEPWTFGHLFDLIKQGKFVQLDGDWS